MSTTTLSSLAVTDAGTDHYTVVATATGAQAGDMPCRVLQLSIVGYDNTSYCDLTQNALTSVDQSGQVLGLHLGQEDDVALRDQLGARPDAPHETGERLVGHSERRAVALLQVDLGPEVVVDLLQVLRVDRQPVLVLLAGTEPSRRR